MYIYIHTLDYICIHPRINWTWILMRLNPSSSCCTWMDCPAQDPVEGLGQYYKSVMMKKCRPQGLPSRGNCPRNQEASRKLMIWGTSLNVMVITSLNLQVWGRVWVYQYIQDFCCTQPGFEMDPQNIWKKLRGPRLAMSLEWCFSQVESSQNGLNSNWRFPDMGGTPSHHPFYWVFPLQTNHFGVPPWLWKPPISWIIIIDTLVIKD